MLRATQRAGVDNNGRQKRGELLDKSSNGNDTTEQTGRESKLSKRERKHVWRNLEQKLAPHRKRMMY